MGRTIVIVVSITVIIKDAYFAPYVMMQQGVKNRYLGLGEKIWQILTISSLLDGLVSCITISLQSNSRTSDYV